MKVTSLSRGSFTTRGLFIELRSPLGLCYSQRCYEAPLTISVYPDLNYQDAYGLLARANRLHQGRRRRRAANGDNEFERLRNYQQGDSLNRIDWKASPAPMKLSSGIFKPPSVKISPSSSTTVV